MQLPNQPQVLAATINPITKTKMISFLLDIPTVLLAELRTHKIITQGNLYEHMEHDTLNLSANSARALPTSVYVDKMIKDPFVPMWTSASKGMSGGVMTETKQEDNDEIWLKAMFAVEGFHGMLVSTGAHKQNANRILAPWAWTTCILTGTEWVNFFELRCPKYVFEDYDKNKDEIITKVFKSKKEYLKYFTKLGYNLNNVSITDLKGNLVSENTLSNFKEEDWQNINKSPAQPEFQVIAEFLYDLYNEADYSESPYHIPFIKYINTLFGKECISETGAMYDKMLVSASLCAKLSYDTHNNEDSIVKHTSRAEKLLKGS